MVILAVSTFSDFYSNLNSKAFSSSKLIENVVPLTVSGKFPNNNMKFEF